MVTIPRPTRDFLRKSTQPSTFTPSTPSTTTSPTSPRPDIFTTSTPQTKTTPSTTTSPSISPVQTSSPSIISSSSSRRTTTTSPTSPRPDIFTTSTPQTKTTPIELEEERRPPQSSSSTPIISQARIDQQQREREIKEQELRQRADVQTIKVSPPKTTRGQQQIIEDKKETPLDRTKTERGLIVEAPSRRQSLISYIGRIGGGVIKNIGQEAKLTLIGQTSLISKIGGITPAGQIITATSKLTTGKTPFELIEPKLEDKFKVNIEEAEKTAKRNIAIVGTGAAVGFAAPFIASTAVGASLLKVATGVGIGALTIGTTQRLRESLTEQEISKVISDTAIDVGLFGVGAKVGSKLATNLKPSKDVVSEYKRLLESKEGFEIEYKGVTARQVRETRFDPKTKTTISQVTRPVKQLEGKLETDKLIIKDVVGKGKSLREVTLKTDPTQKITIFTSEAAGKTTTKLTSAGNIIKQRTTQFKPEEVKSLIIPATKTQQIAEIGTGKRLEIITKEIQDLAIGFEKGSLRIRQTQVQDQLSRVSKNIRDIKTTYDLGTDRFGLAKQTQKIRLVQGKPKELKDIITIDITLPTRTGIVRQQAQPRIKTTTLVAEEVTAIFSSKPISTPLETIKVSKASKPFTIDTPKSITTKTKTNLESVQISDLKTIPVAKVEVKPTDTKEFISSIKTLSTIPLSLKPSRQNIPLIIPEETTEVKDFNTAFSIRETGLINTKLETRFESKIKPISTTSIISKQEPILKPKTELLIKPTLDLKPDITIKQDTSIITEPITRVKPSTRTIPSTRVIPILDVIPEQKTKPILKVPQRTIPLITPRFTFPTQRIQSIQNTPLPIKPPRFNLPTLTQQRPIEKGFLVAVRRFGEFGIVTPKPLSKQEALSFGAFKVGTTAAATFKLIETDKEATGKFTTKYLSNLYNQFYEKEGKFIEKRKFRISTIGELREITFKGLAAQKSKSTIQNLINKIK